MVKKECSRATMTGEWFYDTHLLAVEKFAKKLLEKLKGADAEVVLLGVWLHDLQRVRDKKGDHAKVGANEAEKTMLEMGYPEKTISHVKEIILSHSCNSDSMPQTVEAKILASADAMSHYVNDFYLKIALLRQRSLPEFKEWSLEKLDRDYNKKIFFDFAKKMIKKRHDVLTEFFSMN